MICNRESIFTLTFSSGEEILLIFVLLEWIDFVLLFFAIQCKILLGGAHHPMQNQCAT